MWSGYEAVIRINMHNISVIHTLGEVKLTCVCIHPHVHVPLSPRGMRSGTVPHPLVVGLGSACDIAAREMEVRARTSESSLILVSGSHIPYSPTLCSIPYIVRLGSRQWALQEVD